MIPVSGIQFRKWIPHFIGVKWSMLELKWGIEKNVLLKVSIILVLHTQLQNYLRCQLGERSISRYLMIPCITWWDNNAIKVILKVDYILFPDLQAVLKSTIYCYHSPFGANHLQSENIFCNQEKQNQVFRSKFVFRYWPWKWFRFWG